MKDREGHILILPGGAMVETTSSRSCLSLADYRKLLGLVAHQAVRAYWDATGTGHMGHPGDGLEVLGAEIRRMHLTAGG